MPALVEERVEAGQQDEWLSESRKLVTVFMRIVGLGERLCEVRARDEWLLMNDCYSLLMAH